MVIVVIGVAGSGKTTVGTMLAEVMKCPFLEGDSLHSKENIAKMSHGIPLTDSDRGPWLSAIHARILDSFERGQDLVVGCSALKQEVPAGARQRHPDNLGVLERLSGTHSFSVEASAESLHEGRHACEPVRSVGRTVGRSRR